MWVLKQVIVCIYMGCNSMTPNGSVEYGPYTSKHECINDVTTRFGNAIPQLKYGHIIVRCEEHIAI